MSLIDMLRKNAKVQSSPEPSTTRPMAEEVSPETPDAMMDCGAACVVPDNAQPTEASPEPERSPSLTKERAPVHVGRSPTVNGCAVPMVNADFNEIFIDDGDSYMKLDCWIFKALTGKKKYMGTLDFKKTKVGNMLVAQFRTSLGRHTRTHWFVDSDRQLVSTVPVDIEGVRFEFLPKMKMIAVKYSHNALSKFAEVAQREIDGTITPTDRCPKSRSTNMLSERIRKSPCNYPLLFPSIISSTCPNILCVCFACSPKLLCEVKVCRRFRGMWLQFQ